MKRSKVDWKGSGTVKQHLFTDHYVKALIVYFWNFVFFREYDSIFYNLSIDLRLEENPRSICCNAEGKTNLILHIFYLLCQWLNARDLAKWKSSCVEHICSCKIYKENLSKKNIGWIWAWTTEELN